MTSSDTPLPFYKPGFDPLKYVNYDGGPAFIEFLKQKQFYLRDMGVSPKIYNQWKRYGLIEEENTEQRKWVILDFGQYLWLSIIQDLRKFGVPLEDIKRIKDRYTIDYFAEVEKILSSDGINATLDKIVDALPGHGDKQKREFKKRVSEGTVFKDMVNKLVSGPSNLLEASLMHMAIVGEPVYLTLFLTDDVPQIEFAEVAPVPAKETGKRKKAKRETCIEFFIHTEQFENMTIDKEQLQKLYEAPHIKLPLRRYIREFISDLKNENRLEKSMLLSKEELFLLKELRKDNILEITIKMQPNKDSSVRTINRIEVTREMKKDAEARLIETFTSKEYADITFKVADGKITSFKKVVKMKPD